jgi:hypothetical protein
MDEMKSRPRPRKTTAKSAARPAAQMKVAPEKPAPAKRPSRAPQPALAEREVRVRIAAYLRAERRGFAPGYEIEDWLAAEAEVGGLEQSKPAAKPRKAPVRKPRTG